MYYTCVPIYVYKASSKITLSTDEKIEAKKKWERFYFILYKDNKIFLVYYFRKVTDFEQ